MADPKNLDEVRQLLSQSKRELMEKYHAEGVAVGKMKLSDDSYVIVVYLASRRDLPTGKAEVDGVPLKFEVTGRFKAQL